MFTDGAACVAAAQFMEPHLDVVEPHHRFESVQFNGVAWDLSHLEAFAFRLDPGLGFEIDVVVLFACHCFTHSLVGDGRREEDIPAEEIYYDGRERRVLSEIRYRLSQTHLARITRELPKRKIQVAKDANFMTFEFIDEDETAKRYAIFFEVEKDRKRKRRMLLRIQSAYILDALTERQKKAGKVGFNVLLKAAYEGRRIRG